MGQFKTAVSVQHVYLCLGIDEAPARRSLAAAPGRPLFGHGRQHLADVRGQEVVHFVALRGGRSEVRCTVTVRVSR